MITWFEKHHRISLIITLAIAVIIFYISSLTFEQSSSTSKFSLKQTIYHITSFFFLEIFLLISLIKGKNKNFFPIIITIGILYGISDEIHQFFVPGRTLSLSDMALDAIGISFASLIYLISLQHRTIKNFRKKY
jgi:VanZ family protein